MNVIAAFQGFEDPPLDVEASTWLERLTALYSNHPGKWAKYGPYTSRKSAQNVASHIKSQLTPDSYLQPEFKVANRIHLGEVWFLYIKVGESNGIPEKGGSA